MSSRDRRAGKKRKDNEYNDNEKESDKPSKQEYKVAKWIRKNVPVKKTKFLNHNVEYFSSSKALDALMESKFATDEKNCIFPTRQHAVDYLDLMLTHKFFHRAKKITVSEQELKSKSKSKDDKGSSNEVENSETKAAADKNNEKKKRKIRLEMHPQQIFRDGHEAYVWIYDPIPVHYWIFGTLVVIGAIVICLFPLWPPQLRTGVYYLSMTAAGFLVFLLVLVVLRFLLFCSVWIITGGKHHFWFLPNLTEDVGFIDSFKPLYKHENVALKALMKKEKKKKKKNSDDEEDDDQQDALLKNEKKEIVKSKEEEEETSNNNKNSGSESSDSQRVGRDFELVEAEEEDDEE